MRRCVLAPGGISRRTGVSARFLKEIEATEVPAEAIARPYPPKRGKVAQRQGVKRLCQAKACLREIHLERGYALQ